MAFSFPLSYAQFMKLVPVEEGAFSLERNDEMSGLGNNQPLHFEVASPLWRFDGTTIPIPNDDAEALAAKFEMLTAPGRDFYIANPRKLGPKNDKSGTILGASTPTIHTLNANNRELRIQGVPPGYVLSDGDMIAWDYGPTGQKRRAMHRLASSVTAASTGITPLFELSTFIRAGAAVNDPVYLAPALMRAKLIPGAYKAQQVSLTHQVFSFSAIQKLI